MTEHHQSVLTPYLLEAGLPLLTKDNAQITIQSLLLYNVFERRKHILDDIAQGLNDVSLINYLKRQPVFADAVFPRVKDQVIAPEAIENILHVEAHSENHHVVRSHFTRYIFDLTGKGLIAHPIDLCQ